MRFPGVIPAVTTPFDASGRVDLDALITGRYALEDTERALRAGLEDAANVKAVVHP